MVKQVNSLSWRVWVLPLVVRIACADFALDTKTLQVGDYIRGNIWLQMTIHAMSTPSAP